MEIAEKLMARFQGQGKVVLKTAPHLPSRKQKKPAIVDCCAVGCPGGIARDDKNQNQNPTLLGQSAAEEYCYVHNRDDDRSQKRACRET